MEKEQKQPQEPQGAHPRGTVVILIIFVITLIVLWGWVYLILLSRGMT
jgi:hypothetical protein